jgi:hypothetical protein
VTASSPVFRDAYENALRGFLLAGGEGQLRIAYELGRQAVTQELSVLELSDTHHDALSAALGTACDAVEARRVVDAGRDFFRESLSAYEMLQRGFRDARDEALQERLHATMLRRLSDLLSDDALAIDPAQSLEEMAWLLAEQARELCSAEASLVTLARADGEVWGVAGGTEQHAWQRLLDDDEIRRLPSLVAPGSKSLRLDDANLVTRMEFQRIAIASPLARSLRGWLAAPLRSVHGGALGAIQVFTTGHRPFGEVDEEVAVYLAQLASAALDRLGRGGVAG